MEQRSFGRFWGIAGWDKIEHVFRVLLLVWGYSFFGLSDIVAGGTVGEDRKSDLATFDFFGEPIVLPSLLRDCFPGCRGWSTKKMERYYRDLFQTDFKKFLNFCTLQADTMHLGDWGYYRLVEQIAAHYFPQDTLSATIFTCFMMRRSGYECTLTYNLRKHQVAGYIWAAQRMDYRHHLYRRGLCYSQVCGTACPSGVELDWAEIEHKINRKAKWRDSLPRLRALNLRMSEAPLIGSRLEERQYRSYADGDSLMVTTCYSPDHLDYYASYPFTSLDVYFNTPLPTIAAERLRVAFLPRLLKLSLYERANFLLHYVQFAYSYETDHAQFGKEKYNFAEESLCYDATDCDDRSVLYAVLLRLLVTLFCIRNLQEPDLKILTVFLHNRR